MTALLVTLPCLVAVIAVMGFRQTGLIAASLAFASTVFLWSVGSFSRARPEHLVYALSDALVLLLLVGVVVFLGLLFVQISNRAGGLDALGDIVHSMNLPEPRALIVITIGLGVTLESLTGFGVSMMVTIPLLLPLVSRTRAIALALLGMSLMPWGALSIATLLGAEIAQLPLQVLANELLLTSGPVALLLPVCCLLLASRSTWQDWVHALLCSSALLAGIAITTHWIGVEVAGVGGGLAVLVLSLLRTRSTRPVIDILSNPALVPYALLIGAIIVQKMLVAPLQNAGFSPILDTGRVTFEPLTSPGLALALACAASLWLRRWHSVSTTEPSPLALTMQRSWRALAGIGLFLLSARLLIESGGVASIAQLLSQMSLFAASSLTVLIGGFGAYATGSGVTSNALFMAGATATGDAFQARVLFAALQHSGAGHVAMASLPIIAVLLAALPTKQAHDERTAMRIGLVLAVLWMLVVAVSGVVQLTIMF